MHEDAERLQRNAIISRMSSNAAKAAYEIQLFRPRNSQKLYGGIWFLLSMCEKLFVESLPQLR
jgi:hypothetical protein